MAYSIGELVDTTRLRKLLESFHALTGSATALIALDGTIVVSVGWQRICADFHRQHPKTRARCIESDTALAARVVMDDSPACYHCPNGLVDAVLPVFIDGNHLCNLFTGQFFFKPPDEDRFRRQAAEMGFEEDDYLAAMREVPVLERAHVLRTLTFLGDLAQVIAGMGADRARLLDSHRAMEQEVAERTADLTRAVAELAVRSNELTRSNKDLEQFAYAVSHDLQEPLRMVISYLQLIEKRHGNEISGEMQEFMDFAVDGARRMSGQIQGLLEFSRITTRGQDPAPTAAAEALGAALANLRTLIEETGATVTFDAMPTVSVDSDQFVRLFQNLLANAMRHRDPTRAPQVHVSAEPVNGMYRFSVRDNGVGIARDQWERIFGIFQRLAPQGAEGGSGIGLALVKRIVERHGGQVWLDSTPGEGSTFYFTLPRQDRDGEAAQGDAA